MTRIASLCCLALAVLTVLLNGSAYRDWIAHGVQSVVGWRERGYRGNGRHTDAYRELAERFVPLGGSVYYCGETLDGRLQPSERSVHLTLSWAMSPTPVRFGGVEDFGSADAIVVGRFRRVAFPGYRCVAENDCAALWLKEGIPVREATRTVGVSPLRELTGVAFVGLLALGFGWLFLWRGDGGYFGGGVWLGVVVVSVVAAGLALTHTFVAPTGLGVYGGKAKLLFLTGGIPSGFFTDSAYSTFQPAYPPGLALMTLVAYVVSGGCGEWLTQLVVVIATALLAAFLFSRTSSAMARLWTLSAMLTSLSLHVSSFYYAEPIVALLVLVGWEHIRERDGRVLGWVLMGLAGLFKNEGLVLLFACWAAFRLVEGRRLASLHGLFAGLSFPLVWQVGCRLAGGTLYDFAVPWNPDLAQLWQAFSLVVQEALLRPWNYAFVWPAAIALPVLCTFRKNAFERSVDLCGLRISVLASGLSVAVFVYILSLSRAPDFDWHLSTALPRLLWVPSLILLMGVGTDPHLKRRSLLSVERRTMAGEDGLRRANCRVDSPNTDCCADNALLI